MSRSGVECVVALCDQWYIKYGEEKWQQAVKEYVNYSETETERRTEAKAESGKETDAETQREAKREEIEKKTRPTLECFNPLVH